MDSVHENLLFHKTVRWLSKGNVAKRVYELREEILVFLRRKGKDDLANELDSITIKLCYWVDIFSEINKINLIRLGYDKTITTLLDV